MLQPSPSAWGFFCNVLPVCPLYCRESMLIDDTNKLEDNSGGNADNAHSINYLKSLTSPIVVKTHLPFELLPKQIKNNIKNPKVNVKICLFQI
jgi:hypothetical protein